MIGIPIPLRFRFRALVEIPILMVTIIGPNIPGVDKKMIEKALMVIDLSSKYQGIPVSIEERDDVKISFKEISCNFQLMFPDQEKLEEAYACIKEKLR